MIFTTASDNNNIEESPASDPPAIFVPMLNFRFIIMLVETSLLIVLIVLGCFHILVGQLKRQRALGRTVCGNPAPVFIPNQC